MGFSHLFSGAIFSQNEESTANTTADNMQVIWVAFADSNYDGQGPTDITCPAGILYKWNGVSLTEITTQTTANGGNFGAPWKQFAIDYNALTGKKIVLVNSARGGSRLYPNGVDPYDWYTTGGIMRAQATAQIDACLAYLGLSEPIATFGNAMVNDIRAGTTIANISTAFDSAVTYVTSTKFPGVPFLYSITGHDESNVNALINIQVRDLIIQKQRTVSNFYIDSSCAVFYSLGLGTLHFTNQSAYNHLGACKARWFANPTRSKYARAIISMHYGALTEGQKDLIENEILAFGNQLFTDLEYLYHVGKVTDSRDEYIDYTLLHAPLADNTTFTANSHVSTTGNSNSLWRTFYNSTVNAIRTTATDQFHMEWIKVITSDATIIRSAFGASNASAQFTIGHTTTGVFYRANDNTLTIARTGVLPSNTLAGAVRNGTTKAYYENGVQIHTATVASSGNVDQNIIAGGRNNGGSNTNPTAGEFQVLVGGKASTINQATLYTIINARESAW
jgi:hypothetical protein